MLRNLVLIAALGAASPAFATGLDIEVAGEANGTVHVELFDDVAPGRT